MGPDEKLKISLSDLQSLFHSHQNLIPLSALQKFLINHPDQQGQDKKKSESGVRHMSASPFYPRKDSNFIGQTPGGPALHQQQSLLYNIQRDMPNDAHTKRGVSSIVKYDTNDADKHDNNDKNNNDENDDADDRGGPNDSNHSIALKADYTGSDSVFGSTSPTSRNRYLTSQLDVLKKKKPEVITRKEEMLKIKEQFQNINARLQDQLRSVIE